jgi:hypothetical protein
MLLLVSPGFALHLDARRSEIDRRPLPLLNVYDPETHQNEDVRQYSYEELNALLSVPSFRRMNDIEKVCQDMQILFGRSGSRCNGYATVPASKSRAYVNYQQPIQQIIVPAPRVITITDPLTPPWSPSFQWYGPRGPYPRAYRYSPYW